MKTAILKGILIDKSRFKDKTLIINVLVDSGELVSGLYQLKQGSFTPDFLYSYEFVVQDTNGRKMFRDARLISEQSVSPECIDQYYLCADLIRQTIKDAPGKEFYVFLEHQAGYFSGNYRSDFHLSFITKIISLFGYLPDDSASGIWFDLRSGFFSNEAPTHSDYCHASLLLPAINFYRDNTSFLRLRDAASRAKLFMILVRYLELQKDVSIQLKSISVLRDLRQ